MKEIKPPQLPWTRQKQTKVGIALILILTAKWWVPVVLLAAWAALLMLWFLIGSVFS